MTLERETPAAGRRRKIPVLIGCALVATVAAAAVLVAAWIAVAGSPFRRSAPTGPLTDEQTRRAHDGVESNAEWEPVTRRIEGLDMALVPAGCFTMGTTDPQLAEAQDSCDRFFGRGRCLVDFRSLEQPAHRVCHPAPFWIGLTEVSNREYGSSSSTDMVSMYRGPDWPRESVTWQEAAGFCESRGLRLPTEAEWEYAARGPDALLYPWGNTFDLHLVVSGRLSPEDVGLVEAGASWTGAYDLSGGVEEWVADRYGPYPTETRTASAGGDPDAPRITRGGSWFSFAAYPLRSAYREPRDPGYATSVVGFRCARDFSP
jgi:formylglycine-generating enzyme required for sulfatase activity